MGVSPTFKVNFGNTNINFLLQFQNPNVILSSPNGFRTLRPVAGPAGPHTSLDSAYGFSPGRTHFSHQGHQGHQGHQAHQGHQGHHGTLPRNFTHGHHSLPSHQVVTNGSLIPNNPSLSPAMTHSTPLRPEWEASPVVRLPDWATSPEPRSFPADYGLPVSRRPEVKKPI